MQPVHLETIPENQEESDRDVSDDEADKGELLDEESEHGDSDAASDVWEASVHRKRQTCRK